AVEAKLLPSLRAFFWRLLELAAEKKLAGEDVSLNFHLPAASARISNTSIVASWTNICSAASIADRLVGRGLQSLPPNLTQFASHSLCPALASIFRPTASPSRLHRSMHLSKAACATFSAGSALDSAYRRKAA